MEIIKSVIGFYQNSYLIESNRVKSDYTLKMFFSIFYNFFSEFFTNQFHLKQIDIRFFSYLIIFYIPFFILTWTYPKKYSNVNFIYYFNLGLFFFFGLPFFGYYILYSPKIYSLIIGIIILILFILIYFYYKKEKIVGKIIKANFDINIVKNIFNEIDTRDENQIEEYSKNCTLSISQIIHFDSLFIKVQLEESNEKKIHQNIYQYSFIILIFISIGTIFDNLTFQENIIQIVYLSILIYLIIIFLFFFYEIKFIIKLLSR